MKFKVGDLVRRHENKIPGEFNRKCLLIDVDPRSIFKCVGLIDGGSHIKIEAHCGSRVGVAYTGWNADNFYLVTRKSHLPEWF